MSTPQTPGGAEPAELHNKTIKVYDRPDKAAGPSPILIAAIVVIVVAAAALYLLRHHLGIHA